MLEHPLLGEVHGWALSEEPGGSGANVADAGMASLIKFYANVWEKAII